MQAMIRLTILFTLTGLSTMSWSQDAGTAALPDDGAGRCRYGAEYMIEIARQSLSEPSSRPERIEKRRKLVDDWTAQLEKGEDPCLVYLDIQNAATTF
jgi:hypothetical protein